MKVNGETTKGMGKESKVILQRINTKDNSKKIKNVEKEKWNFMKEDMSTEIGLMIS
jgi:hypothetical protein